MPTVIDDIIDVAFSPEGQPVSFVWQRFLYTVTGQPQAYFRRLPPWWHGGSPPSASIRSSGALPPFATAPLSSTTSTSTTCATPQTAGCCP